MGTLSYDGAIIEFDDRLLSHLQIVIVQKLGRGESFAMSWLDALEIGDGRSCIWLHPLASLYFKFAGSRVPAIDEAWLGSLRESAASSKGLVVVDEFGKLARSSGINRRPTIP